MRQPLLRGPARALGAATGLWTGLQDGQDGQDEAPILKILKSCQTNPAETAGPMLVIREESCKRFGEGYPGKDGGEVLLRTFKVLP